jgi:UPF0716 protein FxsA
MLPSLRLALVLIFVAFPLLEIVLLIKAGETIGFWPTVAILIASAALGMIVIREQGLSMVSRMLAAMSEGRFPLEPLLDGYVLVMAGFLLIVPGFLSDAIGLLLLVPPLRRSGIRWALTGLAGRSRASEDPRAAKVARPTVIEGTYERLGEHDVKTNDEP